MHPTVHDLFTMAALLAYWGPPRSAKDIRNEEWSVATAAQFAFKQADAMMQEHAKRHRVKSQDDDL